jgi:hypothetical protein
MTGLYTPASNLEVPGLEAILEYGDASTVVDDRIPRAMLINDHSRLDTVRVTQLDGLHDDPEGADSRQPNADRHGETAGNMLYRGRTVGITGRVEAGNIGAMRDNWRRFRGQFGLTERDLLVHHPREVRSLINELANPSLATDGYGWIVTSTGGGTTPAVVGGVADGIMSVGSMTITGATGAGTLRAYGALLDTVTGIPLVSDWDGKDVWLTVRVKVQSATGTVTSLGIGLVQWISLTGSALSFSMSSSQASVSSPVTGTWQTITFRVPATAIAPATTHVTPFLVMNFSGAGTYSARFHRYASVLLDPEDPSPVAYFDGDTAGFGWQGKSRQSRSIGPTHAENKIADPRFEDVNTTTRALTSWASIGTATTYNTPPSSTNRWSGDHVDGALYVKATKNVTSSAAFGVVAEGADGNAYFSAVEFRIYRFSARVNTLQKPAGGSFRLAISWMNEAGSAFATHTSDVITLGEDDYSVLMTAPSGTCAAQALAQVSGLTTNGEVLEFYLSDPCFVDVTDWDPGDFYGVGDAAQEVDVYRRIPRPFLLRRVRKTSDMKAPEQQSRSRAWRDFSMSLRASDPRIYCLDERRRSYEMPLKSALKIAMQNPSSFTLLTTPAPVPVGATYEGQSIPSTVRWNNQSMKGHTLTLGPTPFGGVNLDLAPGGANHLITRPATPVVARFYRSLEGYTYTEPRVVAGCSPVVDTTGDRPGNGVDFSAFSPAGYSNVATVLLKRVSSTTWLELRWSALSNGRAHLLSGGSAFGLEPYAFELWCSHNTSGTLASTRLATWGYTSTSESSLVNVPFDTATEKAYLDVSLVSNVVSWSLWVGGYPTKAASPHKIESGSYTIPAGLAAVVGSAVAGQAGFAMEVDNAVNSLQWLDTGLNPPFVHFLRFSNASELAPVLGLPVIGDVDTAPELVLNGPIADPVVSLQVPSEDGSLNSYSAFFEGALGAGEKLVIGNDKIVDGSGANRYGMLQPGSVVPNLQPGVNYLSLSATDWDESLAENASISWRDALS